MWAAQFRQPSPPLRARTPLPMPPHPLQIVLPSAPQYPFVQDRHTFLVNWQTPATPHPSIILSDSSNSLRSTFSNNNDPMMVAGDNIKVHPGEWMQWDQLLYYFAQGKNMGWWSQDYLLLLPLPQNTFQLMFIHPPGYLNRSEWMSHLIWSNWDQDQQYVWGPVTSRLLLCSRHTHYARGNRSNAMARRRIPDRISRWNGENEDKRMNEWWYLDDLQTETCASYEPTSQTSPNKRL